MLRATTACTFSTSQLPNVVRRWCVSYVLTSKCASGHNGVQLFISHLTTWLCTRRFSEPTFRPSGATNHWKSTVFRDFPTFSHTWTTFFRRLFLSSFFFLLASCFLLLASSFLLLASCTFLLFSSLLFSALHLSILSYIVGSLTSNLPSTMSTFLMVAANCRLAAKVTHNRAAKVRAQSVKSVPF